MESSICVAVITTLPAAITFLIIIFWMIGTSSSGISTPMSPRATMIPSQASMIESMLSTPWEFSILAMIRISSPPFAFKNAFISLISSAVLVKEAATKSTSCLIPNKRSSLSFSLMNGMESSTPGMLTPLRLEIVPPFSTLQWISCPLIATTFNPTRPSSIKMLEPTWISLCKSLWVTLTISFVPSTSLVVRQKSCPISRVTLSSLNVLRRISGPFVSNRHATGRLCFVRKAFTLSILFFWFS